LATISHLIFFWQTAPMLLTNPCKADLAKARRRGALFAERLATILVWHAKSEAWAWELGQMFLAIHHAFRKLRDVPHGVGHLSEKFKA
jgi:hypothetical protein